MEEAENPKLVESGEDIALLSEQFFVIDDDFDQPDRFLVVGRQSDYAATVVAKFKDFDYAHFCARRLSEYHKKYAKLENDDPEATI